MAAFVGLASCGQASEAGQQCDDQACFSEQFAHCKAATYTTEKRLGGQARYRTLGTNEAGCQVQMRYMTNPNPAWVDKALTMTLDPSQPFAGQMKAALQFCLTRDKPGAYQCEGALRGIASVPGQAKATTREPDRTANMQTLGAAQLPAITDDAPRRFPVEADGRWGYIDRAGELVIEARFEAADDFYNGLAAVQIGGLFGYIDREGTLVIKPQFTDAGAFSEGLAAVQPEDRDRLGFIDRDGMMVIPARFDATYGAVDRTRFANGLAPAQDAETWDYGYIDSRGQWAIEPQYSRARPFSEGLAAVEMPRRTWAYINADGEVVLENKWLDALGFVQGLAAVETRQDGHDGWHYVDKQGKVAVAPVFGTQRNSSRPDRARSFSEGLGLVYFDGPRQWQYVTATKFGDEAKFTEMTGIHSYGKATPFRGGLARVVPVYRQGDRGGDTIYIDRQGNHVWPGRNDQ